MMKDDDFKLFRGFEDRKTNRQTDIGDCRVAFATDYNSTYIAASCGKIQTFLVYHRTVIILKGFKSVVKLRYIKTSLIFRPVTV